MQRLRILVWSTVVMFSIVCEPLQGAAVSADDIATLQANVVAWYTRGAPSAGRVRGYVRALKPDGSWSDVDYENTDRGGWVTYGHLSRTLALAQAYTKPGHELAGSADLRGAIEKALAHWVQQDYQNSNWWYPQIGVPQTMAPILILMGDAIDAELTDKAISQVLGRSRMGMTGQNKVWLAGIAFLKGILIEDAALMTKARAQILEELRITTAEGVQPDYSFHQHGPQLQWGNYGASFGSNMIQWASIFQGTAYAIDPESLRILGDYLAEGPAWVLWHGRMDISGCGRQIFRGSQQSKGRSALRQLEMMADIDSPHADRYRRTLASNRPGAANTLVGHKHFWRSDISVHRRPTWYASVKMSSTRVIGAETCNSENMLGLHLGDGVTYFHRTGAEYEDLFPVWDWQRLPGATCAQSDGTLVPSSKRCRGRSDLVGGVSDGDRGAAAMEYVRDGLRARKAWFFLDQAVVCLGAGIDSDGPDSVLTSINQCALKGPITVSTGQAVHEVRRGEQLTDNLAWVHHDGVGYVFPRLRRATVRGVGQSGDWYRVHHRESRRAVERDVFSLWIDHGAEPDEARYAYAVLPNVTVGDMRAAESLWPVSVLAQTTSLLAISSDGGRRVQAVFFEPGQLAWDGASSIEV
ncbi:MAG: polysaccharide lyase 8 family protein [Phycisphaerales bacterium]|nr:MAG: polysaccharide lyase 8 family protein [Phycisphaerales bacterium]